MAADGTATADALATLLPGGTLASAESIGAAFGRPPEAVVRPSGGDEVATVMRWATREGVGVLPMASGRRAAPVRREGRYIALSTERLSGIEEYEAADLTITAGAGTPFATVGEALAENGQWAPFDPPHPHDRSLGGLAATGDSGPLRMAYGDLRHHALGMKVVTGDGRLLRLGGRVVKNVAGYDLVKAMVGSRGSLAVIVSVCLRAFPRPQVDRVLVLSGVSARDLLPTALDVGTAPILPASCVVADHVDEVGGPAMVVRLHGARETVDADQRSLEEHVGASFHTMGEVGPDRRPSPDGRAAADRPIAILDRIRDRGADHPVVVSASSLPSRLGDVLDALEPLDADTTVLEPYEGLVRMGISTADEELLREAAAAIEELGGAVRVVSSADHPQATGLRSAPTKGEAALVGRLRQAFDPGGALWPGGALGSGGEPRSGGER